MLHQYYFETPSSSNEPEVYSLFKLTVTNDGQLPVSMHVKLGRFLVIQGAKGGICYHQRSQPCLENETPNYIAWSSRVEYDMTCI